MTRNALRAGRVPPGGAPGGRQQDLRFGEDLASGTVLLHSLLHPETQSVFSESEGSVLSYKQKAISSFPDAAAVRNAPKLLSLTQKRRSKGTEPPTPSAMRTPYSFRPHTFALMCVSQRPPALGHQAGGVAVLLGAAY
ncbi:hypothetical protein H920_06625 [Fukomys damarensis]|uniref:Uncharacterized protein n=1 Tax=Fukomys damarensis TaxID=885580 RepID=A0A091EA05_FUKDA|nr:hypothetical protein H920_06625 [Fukomys damarensis]